MTRRPRGASVTFAARASVSRPAQTFSRPSWWKSKSFVVIIAPIVGCLEFSNRRASQTPERIGVGQPVYGARGKRRNGGANIEPDVLVELRGEDRFEIVALQLRLRPVDHADGALQQGLGQPVYDVGRERCPQRQQPLRAARVVAQRLVAAPPARVLRASPRGDCPNRWRPPPFRGACRIRPNTSRLRTLHDTGGRC